MRYRIPALCLLLLLFSLGCSNKSSDQTSDANQAAPASAPATTESGSSSAQSAKPPLSAASEPRVKPAEKPPAPVAVVIPAGTSLTVRTQTAISSKTAQPGESFAATLADPISVDGKEVVPEGSTVEGKVVDAKAKGKIKGEAVLKLELVNLVVKGNTYPIRTSMTGFSQKGKGKRTAATTGGGAALGAIIGGIAGGGKGAGIGALAGAGAGFVGGAFTGNKQIELPAETALTFKLDNSVTLK